MHEIRNVVQKGFTLVELLIVIVVIAILAAIATSVYSSAQDNARVTALHDAFKSYKKSLLSLSIANGVDGYIVETQLLGVNNPTINSIAADTRYKDFVKPITDGYGITSTTWYYDYDGDTLADCATAGTGVGIFTDNVPTKYIDLLESKFDDGSSTCGIYRLQSGSPGRLFYIIDKNQ